MPWWHNIYIIKWLWFYTLSRDCHADNSRCVRSCEISFMNTPLGIILLIIRSACWQIAVGRNSLERCQYFVGNVGIFTMLSFCLWLYETAISLRWRHNELDGVSDHQPHDCLLNRLFRQIKENIKAPRYWPLCGEFTGDRWIPRTKGQ